MQLYKLCLILISCCKIRLKMLVFDRPSFSPLLWLSAVQSTIQPPLSCWYLNAWMLRMPGRKSRGYTRYSPAILFPPLLFCIHVAAIRSWSPGVDDPGAFFDVKILDGQELIGGSQAGGLAFSICVLFVLAFLRHNLYLVSVLRYYCFRWLCVIKLMYSSPRGPWLVIMQLVLIFW